MGGLADARVGDEAHGERAAARAQLQEREALRGRRRAR